MEYKPTPKDVQDIKAINGIPSNESKHDEYIETMLPMLLEAVISHTNNNFGGIQADGSVKMPGPVKIYLAKAIERNTMKTGLKSRSMGSVSYSYDTKVPEELKDLLTPYKKVRFNASRR